MIAWRAIQRQNFIRFSDLANFLKLSAENRALCLESANFRLNVPRRLAQKMEKNNPQDPIFLQFVPLCKEIEKVEGFVLDPLCEADFRKSKKLLKKYAGRALLVMSSACAMHCRYCFRQNFDYDASPFDITEELHIIENDPTIHEVILSGGDPLSLSDENLRHTLTYLDKIPHVKRIRFHTRFPIGIPERINDSFLSVLSSVKKKIYFIIHVNHPKELDSDVVFALNQIMNLKIPVLNQGVLLKGVNDNPETLLELCETLVDHGVLPYYLYLLDPVEGGAHFSVDLETAEKLIESVQESLSGYGVPKLAKEIPGMKSKTTNLQLLANI